MDEDFADAVDATAPHLDQLPALPKVSHLSKGS